MRYAIPVRLIMFNGKPRPNRKAGDFIDKYVTWVNGWPLATVITEMTNSGALHLV